MARTVAYILLLLLSVQTAAIWVLPAYRIQEIKTVHHSHRRQQENILVRMDASRFSRSRSGSHEIWIDGALYDIQSIDYQGEMVAISLAADQQEQSLLEWMNEAVFQSPYGAAKTPYCLGNHLLQFFQGLYLPLEKAEISVALAILESLQPLFYSAGAPAPGVREVLAPPPECRLMPLC